MLPPCGYKEYRHKKVPGLWCTRVGLQVLFESKAVRAVAKVWGKERGTVKMEGSRDVQRRVQERKGGGQGVGTFLLLSFGSLLFFLLNQHGDTFGKRSIVFSRGSFRRRRLQLQRGADVGFNKTLLFAQI